MSIFDIEPVTFENASISIEDDSRGISLILSGDIDMRDTSLEFLPYLLKIHDALVQNKVKNIRLDLLKLTFMNSNGIKSLINWIMKLSELPEAERYGIRVIANNNIAWQESTLPVLCKLFPGFITIEQV